MTRPRSALVIGAGLAGMTAARSLAALGVETVVVDKGRAVGGRMASRRFEGGRFDHGAQHFSARTDAFAAEVAELVAADVVHRWYDGTSITRPELGVEPRWTGSDGMRGVVEALAQGLDVRTGVRITGIEHSPEGWTARGEGGEGEPAGPGADEQIVAGAEALILTPPLPQTLDLLTASGLVDDPAAVDPAAVEALRSVRYAATLAVLARLDGPSGLVDGHAALGEGDWPVAWLADNHHKGVSPEPAVTIHSTETYAAAHLDAEPETWTPELVAAAQTHLQADVVAARGHRWRYARPINPLDCGALVLDGDRNLIVAGEAFAGAKVEGAYTSGRAAATLLGAAGTGP